MSEKTRLDLYAITRYLEEEAWQDIEKTIQSGYNLAQFIHAASLHPKNGPGYYSRRNFQHYMSVGALYSDHEFKKTICSTDNLNSALNYDFFKYIERSRLAENFLGKCFHDFVNIPRLDFFLTAHKDDYDPEYICTSPLYNNNKTKEIFYLLALIGQELIKANLPPRYLDDLVKFVCFFFPPAPKSMVLELTSVHVKSVNVCGLINEYI